MDYPVKPDNDTSLGNHEFKIIMNIFNTLTKQKEEFKPIKPNHINMYICGVTVYDECHLGHARAYVSFDVIRRYFEYKGFKVNWGPGYFWALLPNSSDPKCPFSKKKVREALEYAIDRPTLAKMIGLGK